VVRVTPRPRFTPGNGPPGTGTGLRVRLHRGKRKNLPPLPEVKPRSHIIISQKLLKRLHIKLKRCWLYMVLQEEMYTCFSFNIYRSHIITTLEEAQIENEAYQFVKNAEIKTFIYDMHYIDHFKLNDLYWTLLF
jgi:hypothetical protein